MSSRRAKFLRKQVLMSMEANHIDKRLFKNTYRNVKRLYNRDKE